jgi:hypothetical protein
VPVPRVNNDKKSDLETIEEGWNQAHHKSEVAFEHTGDRAHDYLGMVKGSGPGFRVNLPFMYPTLRERLRGERFRLQDRRTPLG